MLNKLNKIIERIFSISDYGETHRIIRLYGIKIKYPKPEFRKERDKNPFYYYKKNKIDIRTLPPAKGQIRDIQLANLAILKEFDKVCKEHGLNYWLFAGTALGAVRHKGFIPWDDDIDTGMMRDDYDKIIDVFNKYTSNKELYAKLYNNDKKDGFITKICHKYCEKVFIDIFAADFSNNVKTKKEQIKITSQIIKDRSKCGLEQNSANSKNLSAGEYLKKYLNLRDKYIPKSTKEKSDILLGIEWMHSEKNWFINYDSLFPLIKTSFEGCEFNAMQNADDYLTDYYGNYMKYPPKITMGHGMYLDLTDEEKKVIEKLKGNLK